MTIEFKADMHCHSTCSDGSLTPLELLDKAYEIGLKGLSITDHDTVEAYKEETFKRADELGIRLCTGVEFSCQLKQVSVHVLAYGIDIHSQALQMLCEKHRHRRLDRNRKILAKLARQGMRIGEDELLEFARQLSTVMGVKAIGRPHIALLMVHKGFVSSVQDAFRRYIGDQKSCFDPGLAVSIEETLQVIHAAKGKAFIAHPHLIKRKKIVRELLKAPFDGIECYYALFPLCDNARWITLAQDKGWLISGGSDFHGDLRPFIPLGASFVNEEVFNKILVT